MRLFLFDGCEIAAISDDGRAKLLSDDGSWVPAEWSRKMALEVVGDERAIELSAVAAAERLSRRGAELPAPPKNDG